MIFHANDSGRGYCLWPNISYLHKIMFYLNNNYFYPGGYLWIFIQLLKHRENSLWQGKLKDSFPTAATTKAKRYSKAKEEELYQALYADMKNLNLKSI